MIHDTSHKLLCEELNPGLQHYGPDYISYTSTLIKILIYLSFLNYIRRISIGKSVPYRLMIMRILSTSQPLDVIK